MVRKYTAVNHNQERLSKEKRIVTVVGAGTILFMILLFFPGMRQASPSFIFFIGILFTVGYAFVTKTVGEGFMLESARKEEERKRDGADVLGLPPERNAVGEALKEADAKGKNIIDKYLVGFELDSGKPLWISDDDICTHGAVFAKTGVGKTLWLESLIFQQMARGRASGCTFIDAKRDSGTLAHIIAMAIATGRIEDLIVIDPFDPVHSYNFVMTKQRPDIKARKILRAGLPPTSDSSSTKHYDRLAADSIYRLVRAMESFGVSWTIRDIGASLAAFSIAYPKLREMLQKMNATQAIVELGHLASSYRTVKGAIDATRMTDNLRGIASELNSIAGSDIGQIFCTSSTDLVLTDAILRGKIVYYMLPRLEEAESAARMVKVFREDLEVSIGEITASRNYRLEDPHLVIVDEGSSTFGPTWANLFELARKGRFALLFGAQSAGGLSDQASGLSQAFYERVMANVNLKVMMRVGDNRTAMDMAEWAGKIVSTKTTVGAAVSSGSTGSAFRGPLDLQVKRSGNESRTVNMSESDDDLVSAEELKHEMSAEKGLAWFDLGKGKIVKGRALWMNMDIPEWWEGREFLTRFEKMENDEIGIADYVDRHILDQETGEMMRERRSRSESKAESKGEYPTERREERSPPSRGSTRTTKTPIDPTKPPESSGPPEPKKGFKLVGRLRGKGTVVK